MRFLRRLWTWLFGPPVVQLEWVESPIPPEAYMGTWEFKDESLSDHLHPWRSD